MALKYRSTERFLKPDPVYGSKLISKFIGCLMGGGKRSAAERIVYKAMDILGERVDDDDPLEAFEKAIDNVKPVIEVRSRRIGGMTYQVPIEVTSKRQTSLAIRWILDAADNKEGRPMYLCLAEELIDAYHRQGAAYTQRENTHRMAEANRDFSHFSR
ncbi:MAG: 30S ribosomal protein S7 [Planctomycetes bacterium]|nr:30S ribosomal protein S7 [Planctomycetota bacterium]